jgi:hypothetical protein
VAVFSFKAGARKVKDWPIEYQAALHRVEVLSFLLVSNRNKIGDDPIWYVKRIKNDVRYLREKERELIYKGNTAFIPKLREVIRLTEQTAEAIKREFLYHE